LLASTLASISKIFGYSALCEEGSEIVQSFSCDSSLIISQGGLKIALGFCGENGLWFVGVSEERFELMEETIDE